jgi:hypothetical protein
MEQEKNVYEELVKSFARAVFAVAVQVGLVLLALLIAHKWLNWF